MLHGRLVHFLGIFLGTLLFTSCATTHSYKGDELNYKDEQGTYRITATIQTHQNPGLLTTEIRNSLLVYVNNFLVINAPLHNDHSGSLQGIHEGRTILANCSRRGIFSPTECVIHVDNLKVGTLVLRISP